MATALVTGASSGIGLELSRLFAADRHDVVLVARREDRLKSLADELTGKHKVTCTPIAVDLADPHGPAQLLDRLAAESITIDFLVNNAGFGLVGHFSDTDWADEAQMLQLNVVSLTELTKKLLPGMIARRNGRILNVASTAGFQPGPGMAVYYATKAYVISFSEAVTVELAGTGVTVTTLAPGVTKSEFQARAGAESIRLTKVTGMSAADVAQAGYRGMLAGRQTVVPGLLNKVGVQALRVGPRWVVPRVVARLHQS